MEQEVDKNKPLIEESRKKHKNKIESENKRLISEFEKENPALANGLQDFYGTLESASYNASEKLINGAKLPLLEYNNYIEIKKEILKRLFKDSISAMTKDLEAIHEAAQKYNEAVRVANSKIKLCN